MEGSTCLIFFFYGRPALGWMIRDASGSSSFDRSRNASMHKYNLPRPKISTSSPSIQAVSSGIRPRSLAPLPSNSHIGIMSATHLPNGYKSFGPKANCTLEVCPLEASLLRYRPSVPVNGTFIGLFALAMIIHTIQGLRSKNWGFMASMIGGCLLEIVGYVGRLILNDNPFSFGGFLLQISKSLPEPDRLAQSNFLLLQSALLSVQSSSVLLSMSCYPKCRFILQRLSIIHSRITLTNSGYTVSSTSIDRSPDSTRDYATSSSSLATSYPSFYKRPVVLYPALRATKRLCKGASMSR